MILPALVVVFAGMRTPAELRELAAYHRRIALTATTEGEAWRRSVAEYLESLATDMERAQKPATR